MTPFDEPNDVEHDQESYEAWERTQIVARAIKLCEAKIAFYNNGLGLGKHAHDNFLSWQTHLAELKEHKTVSFVTINVRTPEVGKVFDYEKTCVCGSVTTEFQCSVAELKAKRLMGETG